MSVHGQAATAFVAKQEDLFVLANAIVKNPAVAEELVQGHCQVVARDLSL